MHPSKRNRKALSINDLPDDCLSLVYRSLKFSTDHSSFGLVCRHWLHIQDSNQESLWDFYNSRSSLCDSPKISPESFSKILCKLLIRFQQLKRVNLSRLPEVTEYVTSQSHLFKSKVQFLSLNDCSEYSDKTLSLILSLFQPSTSVCLSGTCISDKGLEVLAKCCSSLEKVELENCQQITDTGLEVLAQSCASLENIDLKNCQQITDKSLAVLKNYCALLKGVDVSDCQKITNKGLEALAKYCGSLKEVQLKNCEGITDQGLIVLAKCCASLENVNLGNNKKITDLGLESLAKYQGSLKKVNFSNCTRVTDKGLAVLAKCCASLKAVDLEFCEGITDKGLEVLAKSCASLETVRLTSCQGITDSGISFLVQNCSKLRSLCIMFCESVTGIGFLGCPKTLSCVSASFVPKLTTEGIKAIVSGGGIESLYVSGSAVNNEAVITISKSCPLLEYMWLEYSDEIQLEGWKAVGLYCRNLEYLFVLDCPNLCDQGLEALCYGCNKLSHLFVDKWSDFGLELFKRERPNVHIGFL